MKVNYKIKVLFSFLCVSCAGVPKELADARQAYAHASESPNAKYASIELQQAQEALFKAEQAYEMRAKAFKIQDLAYAAKRKAQLAEVQASTAAAKKQAKVAAKEYDATQGHILHQTKKEAADRHELIQRAQADKNEALAKIQADLDKLSAAHNFSGVKVSQEKRGLVITLSGSVLFSFNKSELTPIAQKQLREMLTALRQDERHLLIEGHTDAIGTPAYNLSLSKKRAEAVRSFLISQGYNAEKIEARGRGFEQPITSNSNPEDRASNRRVEIIIQSQS